MMDDAAKKARDEYLKKYLSKDDKQLKKKRKKKKSGTGFVILYLQIGILGIRLIVLEIFANLPSVCNTLNISLNYDEMI